MKNITNKSITYSLGGVSMTLVCVNKHFLMERILIKIRALYRAFRHEFVI